MKKKVKLFSLLMVVCMLLSSCAQSADELASIISDSIENNSTIENTLDTGAIGSSSDLLGVGNGSNSHTEHHSATNADSRIPEKGTYNEGVALVKYDCEMNDNVLSQLNLVSASALYSGSKWYTVELAAEADTVETVTYLRSVDCFEKVDYDYIMGTTETSEADVTNNPNYSQQTNLSVSKVPQGWAHNADNPGGNSNVVIAVIDTGVDYNHLDLRNNIWVNSAEIPNNGKDDDKNGYVDDVYGWDCVGNDNDPMDDNGHGTHVAGIIAAENNDIGGVGVAYNCKIMVLKAGNSSGYFNNSDIAEAIQYAYMNGATVINMSFGGSNISIAVEEALENAYNTSVLVAAAGNDGACNDISCKKCNNINVSYPAALPYVIGVMSVDKESNHISSFSNYDHNPYDSIEYEVYAVGEGVCSTWPSNKYACLNGTSMAAPTVSGIAALLRSYYFDREVYSTNFIQSQIVNTGSIKPHNKLLGNETDEAHFIVDVIEAFTKIPKPTVNLYDYYIDDNVSISNKNNGNGIIDAGETIRLYISLHNRGGVASNVNVSIDTYRSTVGDENLTDPYFAFVNHTMQLSDIGTYSVRKSDDKYFEIIVSPDCPNDYLVDFNICFTYTNGLDENDNTVYGDDGEQKAQFNVSRGYHLPALITEDTVYTADKHYLVSETVRITKGVTVIFEEGCDIQFCGGKIIVIGSLYFNGTKEQMIDIIPPSSAYCRFDLESSGYISMDYVVSEQIFIKDISSADSNKSVYLTNSRIGLRTDLNDTVIKFTNIMNSYIELNDNYINVSASQLSNSFIVFAPGQRVSSPNMTNNIFYCVRKGSGAAWIYSSGTVKNNMFLSVDDNNTSSLFTFNFSSANLIDNYFSSGHKKYASSVFDKYYDNYGNIQYDVNTSCSDVLSSWPHVVRMEIFDKDGNPITTVGREEIKVRVTFNRPMDKNAGTFLTFGTIEPYADYRIDGEYISDTVWEGTYTLKTQIANGQNFLKINNAWAAEDQTKTVFSEYQLHEFTIDTTVAMSMNLQATATDRGIELTFIQDDYDTLLGYNIYRADSKDGNYTKLNPAILLPTENTFLDANAEPGKTYWYTYTVVLTDFSESNPAGKVVATAMDTLAPNMYHTPINQGYMNNNLVISCTASDNVAISTVTLYYRTVGAIEWKTLNMAKQSDKYSATIFGSDLTLDGIEYYIVASDGRNTINKGSAEAPYTVIVKDASAISRKGDVDGDGVVTTKDALMLMQCINGDLILSDDEFKRADLNGDNVLNSSEALRILQYINGNVSTLDM